MDLSKNVNLTHVEVFYNDLTSLDVSKNTKLERLICGKNDLSSLDVSKNTRLKALSCEELPNLTRLDLSWNAKLERLDCSGDTRLTSLNISQCAALKELDLSKCGLTAVDLSGCPHLDEFIAEESGLKRLDISKNTKLRVLDVYRCAITALDVSKNTKLEELSVSGCPIAALDLTANPALQSLSCGNNGPRSVTLGRKDSLVYLSVRSAAFSTLDISGCPRIIEFYLNGNSSGSVFEGFFYDSSLRVITSGGLLLNDDEVTLGVKEKYEVLSPDSGYDAEECDFESSNKKVAKVSAGGVVTAVKAGKASITVTAPGGEIKTCAIRVKKAPSKVTLTPKALTLGVGQEEELTAKLPSGTACQSFTWTSDDTGVARVDEEGNVKALAVGTATVTVRTYNGKKARCKLTVKPQPTGVSLPASIALCTGQTWVGAATLIPANAYGSITWQSSNSAVVSVSGDRLIARKAGTATVTATAHNGVKAQASVKVVQGPSYVRFEASKRTLGKNESVKLDVEMDGDAGLRNTLAWKSSNAKVASVAPDGTVTALKTGTAKITATAGNGLKATCKITVKKAPSRISISATSATVGVGEVGHYTAKLPSGSASTLTWASSNPAVVSVDSSGVARALKTGTATISVSTFNGRSAYCYVTVCAAPTRVGIELGGDELAPGDTFTLKKGKSVRISALYPSGQYGRYTVSTSSKKVVSVSGGKLKARRKGTAEITVTTYNGLSASIRVQVK